MPRLGINNLLGEDPPLTGDAFGTIGGNTFPGPYDALGRYLFTGISMRF